MEYNSASKGPITMACILTSVVGAVYFVISAYSVVAMMSAGSIAVEEYGRAGLVFVLLLIGAAQIAAGILGIMSLKREGLRPLIKWVGYCILLMAVTYAVTTVMIRGFQSSTIFGIALAIMYLSIVRPTAKKPPETEAPEPEEEI